MPTWIRPFAIVAFAVVAGAWTTYQLLSSGIGTALTKAERIYDAGLAGIGIGIATGVFLHWLECRRLWREYEQCIPPARAIESARNRG